MNRNPQPDTSPSQEPDRTQQQAQGTAPTGPNPNERLEQWEDRYFDESTGESRGDAGPNS